jgi:hypothetical protein
MLIEDGANPLYGHLFTDEDADTRRAERAERLASKLRG